MRRALALAEPFAADNDERTSTRTLIAYCRVVQTRAIGLSG